jgi:hypothetical protein
LRDTIGRRFSDESPPLVEFFSCAIKQGEAEAMKLRFTLARLSVVTVVAILLAGTQSVRAQQKSNSEIPPGLKTPDRVETQIGTLEFRDGAPSAATLQKVYDNLDYIRGVDAFMNSFSGASAYAIRQGFHSIGAEDNSVVIFSELMDSNSLFLTANADTIYSLAILDLTKGPMVVEVPPMALGTLNDMWFGWIIDIGGPGPDRGEGGRYLVVPPDYDGPLPDSGFHVGRSRTTHVLYAVRAFMDDNDPKPAVGLIKKSLKIYPYTPGAFGTSIATALEGKVRLAGNPPVQATKFVEASGRSFNTIPPNDFSYFEMVNEVVQLEPATSFDPELLGQLAAIGIVKGKPFNPDARMRKILTDAAAVGNAASRGLNWRPSESLGWAYYPNSMWANMLWQGGFNFETPPPMITREGYFKPLPSTGARTLNSRAAFYYGYTMDSPGMIMRLPNVGSQYLMGFMDADKNYLDGGKTYKVTLPANIPAGKFWSFTLYDNQTRSMLQTPQRFPRAGSQTYPTPAAVANSDGSTTIYFAPSKPADAKDGNWIQTMPGKGWFTLLRLYSPKEPFFDKTWRLSEIELVK